MCNEYLCYGERTKNAQKPCAQLNREENSGVHMVYIWAITMHELWPKLMLSICSFGLTPDETHIHIINVCIAQAHHAQCTWSTTRKCYIVYSRVFIAFMDFGKTIRMNRNSNLVLGYLFMYVCCGAGERWKVGSHSRVYSGFTGIHVYGSIRFGSVLFQFQCYNDLLWVCFFTLYIIYVVAVSAVVAIAIAVCCYIYATHACLQSARNYLRLKRHVLFSL